MGEELIADDITAVFELVKNAYDADATQVWISLENITRSVGRIVITDNGHGMSYADIRDKWMEPGTPDKVERRLSPGGRAMLGEKGHGRFAVDKLASKLILRSKRKGEPDWTVVRFDWEEFTGDRYLSDVEIPVSWESARSTDDHGLELLMGPVRNQWTEKQVQALVLQLQSLCPPGERNPDFTIYLECTDFPHLTGRVEALDPDEAVAKLEVSIDMNGQLRRELDGKCLDEDIIAPPLCGPLRILLYYFDPPARSRWATRTRRKWEEWAGVRIYRDGFRVLPYGLPGNDWLELNELQSKKFGKYLAVRDILGYVSITRQGNSLLVDTTSREGLRDNIALQMMRELVKNEVILLGERVSHLRKRPEDPRREGGSPATDREPRAILSTTNLRDSPVISPDRPTVADEEMSGNGTRRADRSRGTEHDQPHNDPEVVNSPVSPEVETRPVGSTALGAGEYSSIPIKKSEFLLGSNTNADLKSQLSALKECLGRLRVAVQEGNVAEADKWLKAAEDHAVSLLTKVL